MEFSLREILMKQDKGRRKNFEIGKDPSDAAAQLLRLRARARVWSKAALVLA